MGPADEAPGREAPGDREGATGSRREPTKPAFTVACSGRRPDKMAFLYAFLHFPNSLKMNPHDSGLEKL